MGCGSSKEPPRPAKNDNPPIDEVTIPDLDPKYPAPSPPKTSKDDFYKPADYAALEAKIKQQFSRQIPASYEEFASALGLVAKTDLEKLRAIFVWLFLQDIFGSFYPGVTDPHTPRGYMKVIKTRNGSYSCFFAQLCRAAGIPCNVIRGTGRGDLYHVGQKDLAGLDSAWCAVHVGGNWRLIHLLWAYFLEKQTYTDGHRPGQGTKRASINDFFYLVDPNKMICFCLPKAAPWQLLKTKWDNNKFASSPQFTEHYFTSGLMLPKKYNAVVEAENNLCVIDFDHQPHADLAIAADVEFDQPVEKESARGEGLPPSGVNMTEYVITSSASNRKTLVVKFPRSGRYMAVVYSGTGAVRVPIVEFRLDCKRTEQSACPFPLRPAEGFGLLVGPAGSLGISDMEPDSGIVLVKVRQSKLFTFTATQDLDLHAQLSHSRLAQADLEDFVNAQITQHQGQIKVVVPDETNMEFGLQVSARPAGSTRPWAVVANYLLVDENWRKQTAVVKPRPSNRESARRALIAATSGADIGRLEQAVDDFTRQKLPDNGDLTRALERLVELHLENLRVRTKARKLEPLDAAIASAKRSHVSDRLVSTQEMADAEAVRRQLRRLKLYMHKVLALNKATISEIHRYQRPRPLVHNVMKATFRILGEPQNRVQDWSYIQTCMRQLGRNSMMARVQQFDPIQLRQRQVQDAEGHLTQTNKYLVRMCSAGAGTFYVWSNNMISEYQGKGQLDPLEIWQSSTKWDKTTPRGSVGGSPTKHGAGSPTRSLGYDGSPTRGRYSGSPSKSLAAEGVRGSPQRHGRISPIPEGRRSADSFAGRSYSPGVNQSGLSRNTATVGLSGTRGQGPNADRYTPEVEANSPRATGSPIDHNGRRDPNLRKHTPGWSDDAASLDDWNPNAPDHRRQGVRYR